MIHPANVGKLWRNRLDEWDRVEITRRQLLGAGIGLAGSSLLEGRSDATGARPAFSLRQTVVGRRVTSGRTVGARFAKNVSSGSLLVAVVSRLSVRTLAPTIGQISDDEGNHWMQAVEYFTADHYGVDIWYCESAGGGNRPTVTGLCLGYPVRPGTDGMRMTLLEYSGARGFALRDQIGQADIRGATATTRTNFGLQSNDELAISVLVGNMSSATVPTGWTSRMADATQRCYVADALSTGSKSAGAPLNAVWTGLTGATGGAAVVATFVPRGVSSRSRRLVQSSYTDSAILPAHRGHRRWTSQAYPVNPTPGNTLVAFMNGSIYHPDIDCGSVIAVTDSVGGRWQKVGESGPDNRTGINISCWICQRAVGGATTLTPTFSNASQQLACLLLEFANLPAHLEVKSVSRRSFGGDLPRLTTGYLSKGDIAFAFRTDVFVLPQGPGSPPWKQVMSDTTGANALMMLDTPAGDVTAAWSGNVVGNGLDILLVALAPQDPGQPQTR
jgi:hypothetical protein